MKKLKKVIHYEKNGEHHYFGSLKALCDSIGADELGLTYPSMRNLGISEDNPYTHPTRGYTIRQGVLNVSSRDNDE